MPHPSLPFPSRLGVARTGRRPSDYVSSNIHRAFHCKARTARINRSVSAEYEPCFVLARRIRFVLHRVNGLAGMPRTSCKSANPAHARHSKASTASAACSRARRPHGVHTSARCRPHLGSPLNLSLSALKSLMISGIGHAASKSTVFSSCFTEARSPRGPHGPRQSAPLHRLTPQSRWP